MNYINSDYILDNFVDVDGWRASYLPFNGTVRWYNTNSGYYIGATPDPETGEVPINTFNTDNGELKDMWTLVFQTGSSIDVQFEQYIQAIRNVIQLLNK